MSVRTVVTGAAGRMGRVLVGLIQADPKMRLVGATERPGADAVGTELGGVQVSDRLEAVLEAGPVDVVIDFTGAESSLGHARACAARGVALVVGSTGFTAASQAEMESLARKIALVMAPNMSVGVNLVIGLAARFATLLGEGYDV